MVGAWRRRGGVVSSCLRVEAAKFSPKISSRHGAVLWRVESPLDGRGCRRRSGVVGVGCRRGCGTCRRGDGVGVVVVLALESS